MRVFGVFKRGVRVSVGVGEAGGEEGEKKRESAGVKLGKEGEEEKEEEEDRRVLGAALAAVCNIVNEFSPLRPVSHSSPPYLFPQSLTVYGYT
jgi:hypothetical protein